MWFLLLWALGIVGAVISIAIHGAPINSREIYRTLLLYQFVITFGLVALIGTVINIFRHEQTAKQLGWPGGPFQIKYGFSQLGLGVMGIMSIWFSGNFWVGTLVTMYIYGLSGLWSHTYLMVKNKQYDKANVANIIMDIIYQGFITYLSIMAGSIWHF